MWGPGPGSGFMGLGPALPRGSALGCGCGAEAVRECPACAPSGPKEGHDTAQERWDRLGVSHWEKLGKAHGLVS